MELKELQDIWAEYDRKLTENTRINKEILKKLLIDKPQKRLTRIGLKAFLDLVTPWIVVVWFFYVVGIRHDWTYCVGVLLTFPLFGLLYYWYLKYFQMIRKVDFSRPVIKNRRDLEEIELLKLRMTKFNHVSLPVQLVGCFLIIWPFLHVPIFALLTIGIVWIMTIVLLIYRDKHEINLIRKFKQDLDELEKLEKE